MNVELQNVDLSSCLRHSGWVFPPSSYDDQGRAEVLTSTLSCQSQGEGYVASPCLCTSPSYTMRIPARKRVHVRSIQLHASNRMPANTRARLPTGAASPSGKILTRARPGPQSPTRWQLQHRPLSQAAGCARGMGGLRIADARLPADHRMNVEA